MEEVIDVLTDLGLTKKQAEVLVALNKSHYATVKDISKVADVHRQEIYPILMELQKIGLIEKRIGMPNQYKAGSLSETLKILLERKNKWLSEVEKKTLEIMKFDFMKKETIEHEKDFTFITGMERCGRALSNWIADAQTIDEILVGDPFSFQIAEHVKMSEAKFRKDVRVRIATCGSLEPLYKHFKSKNAIIQSIPFPVPVDIAIYNGNRAHIAVFSNRVSPMDSDMSILTSNHPCYVQMLQNYFDVLWKTLKPTENARL
jgi:sugar-specific transcriptional regulator TrmB